MSKELQKTYYDLVKIYKELKEITLRNELMVYECSFIKSLRKTIMEIELTIKWDKYE